jgi:hypothetical protein
MNSYGVIEIGDGLMSLPGLFFYIMIVLVAIYLSTKLVDKVLTIPLRKVEYFTAGLSAAVIATWIIITTGMWFYIGK